MLIRLLLLKEAFLSVERWRELLSRVLLYHDTIQLLGFITLLLDKRLLRAAELR